MTTQPGVGLARVVVVAPSRRLEVALPEQVALAGLLPELLRQAGEDLVDDGLDHEGWVLRRADGSLLEGGATLAAQQVRDGETLHLVPRREEWPETAYDDVVDAVAAAARRRGARWSGEATRATGLTAAAVALAVGLVAVAAAGPPWTVPAAAATAAGVLLLVTGMVLARVLGDATAGAVVAAGGMAFAFAGGALALADGPLRELGAPHLLTGSALLVVAALVGYLGVAAHGRVFVAGGLAGACGLVGALAASGPLDGTGAAAVVAGLVLLAGPALPALSMRAGRIPLPDLPRDPEDLVRDDPLPDRRSVDAAAVRADEVLTGSLAGAALAGTACLLVLAGAGGAGPVLVAVVAVAHLLRSRFYVGVRHRVPLLATGTTGLLVLAMAATAGSGRAGGLVALPVLVLVALAFLAAGRRFSGRHPSPRLGRLADVLDVVLTLAVVPLICAVLGLFGYMRALGG